MDKRKSNVLCRAAKGSLKMTEQGVGWRLANLRWPSLPLEMSGAWEKKVRVLTLGVISVCGNKSRTQGQGRDRVMACLCPGYPHSPARLTWTTLSTFSDFMKVKQQYDLSFSWVHFCKFSPDICHWPVPGTGGGGWGAILTLSQWPGASNILTPWAMGNL